MGRILSAIMLLGGMIMAQVQCSTANFDNLQMTTDVDDAQPVDNVDTFDAEQEIVYATGTLSNAPSDTEITAEWYYMEDGETYIDSATLETGSTDFYFSLTQPADGWEPGMYEVRFYIYDDLEETLTFTIE